MLLVTIVSLNRRLSSVKTGRRKLGCIYSQLVQKRLEETVLSCFFFEQTIFFNIMVNFYTSGLKRLRR